MRHVPILDEAYMKRRANEEWMRAMFQSYRPYSRKPDPTPQETVRREYLSGAISVEVFEARLDAIFGLKR